MGNINLTFSEGRHHLFYLDNYLKDTVNEETIIFLHSESCFILRSIILSQSY